MVSQRNDTIWISLVEVEALGRTEEFAPGEKAFVNVLVKARSLAEAERRLSEALRAIGFHVVALEDTEDWEIRTANFEVDPELWALAARASETGEAQWGTFHTWEGQG